MHTFAKNTLVTAAVAAGLGLSTQAFAGETTVYGKLHVSVASLTNDGSSTAANNASSIDVASHASRFGIKSSRKFGDSLEGSVKVEYEIDASGENDKSSTKDILKARNIYVGLKGGFGEVRFGNHDTPHKMATGMLDPFGDTYADYNNVVYHDTRLANTILYMNKFDGLKIAVSYSGGDDSLNTATGENKGNTVSYMASYKTDMLYIAAANEVQDGSTTDDNLKFGAGLTFAGVDVGGVYAKTVKSTGSDVNAYYVSVKAKLGGDNVLKAAYGTNDETNDPQFFALGLDHKLDKQTTIYGLFASSSDGGLNKKGGLANDGTAIVAGAVYNF